MTTTERPTPQRAVLELQARARDHALADEVEGAERVIARVHARLDGAVVTVVPHALAASASADGGDDPTTGHRADPGA